MKDRIFTLNRNGEGLANSSQTGYADLWRFRLPMADGAATAEVQGAQQRPTAKEEHRPSGNGEKDQQQPVNPQEAAERARREAFLRALKREEQRKKLEAFLNETQERVKKRPPHTLTIDELKGEIDQIHQEAAAIDRQGLVGLVRNLFWNEVKDAAKPLYDELKDRNVDVAQLVAIVPPVPEGQEPDESGRTASVREEPMAVGEVFGNALLSDGDRVKKAQEVLGMALTDEQKAAILKAHYEAMDEVGKDSGPAGVYNYTLPQLLRKARILRHEGGFSQEQADTLIKAGIAAVVPTGEFSTFNPGRYTDPAIAPIANEINTEGRAGRADDELVHDAIRRVNEQIDQDRVAAANIGQAQELLRELRRIYRTVEEEVREERGYGRRFGLGISGERVLQPKDRVLIHEDVDSLLTKYWNTDRLPTSQELQGPYIDYYFNRGFDQANARPRDPFQDALGYAGQREQDDFFIELNILRANAEQAFRTGEEISEARKEPGESDANFRKRMGKKVEILNLFIYKYGIEKSMRELLHNAYFIAETEGEFKDFAGYCTKFASVYADQAFLNSPEVEIALRVREQVLYEMKRENNGYIPPEKVTYNPNVEGGSEWELRSRQITEQIIESQGLGVPKWRIDRALSISRGMGMVLLRFPEIIAEQHLPAPSGHYQSQPSVPWEKLVWDLNPMDFKLRRYEMGFELRTLMYAVKERTKGKGLKGVLPWNWWKKEELEAALAEDTISTMGEFGKDKRMINMRNLFQTGGPFTHTGWRPYMAAVDDNREGLRPLLARNPGLAMRMIFNNYENRGQAKRRWDIIRDNPDMPHEELMKLWEHEKGKYEVDDKNEWAKQEVDYWLSSAKRVPHVVLRILTDKENTLMSNADRKALFRSVLGEDYSAKAYTDAELGLTLAKENLMKRRAEAIRDAEARGVPLESVWTEPQDQLLQADFDQITDGAQKDNAIQLHKAVVKWMKEQKDVHDKTGGGIYKQVLDNIGRGGFAFAVTAEDVPWSEFVFGQTGPRGFFTRKINDALSCAEGNEEMIQLVKYVLPQARSPEQIIEQLGKIYKPVEIYGKDFAADAVADIALGVIRLYQKDGILKVPIIGDILRVRNAFLHRGSSYAETIYGSQAMDWDSDDIYNFTEQLRTILVGKKGFDLIQKIRKETGGTWWQALLPRTKIAFYLLLAVFLYEMTNKILTEK